MNTAFNLPLNGVSFGVVSLAILREIFRRNLTPSLFLIGQPDLSAQKEDRGFSQWINQCITRGMLSHSRKHPAIKLWHIFNGGMESFSAEQFLFTFHETDEVTPAEVNTLNNQKGTFVTSNFTKRVFEEHGVRNVHYVPLGFDSYNFYPTNKKYQPQDIITFGLFGKWEKRKHTAKIIQNWVKVFGNKREYRLHAAVYNQFYNKPGENEALIAQALDGKSYWNVEFCKPVGTNVEYNDIINSTDIVLALSGGEGRGLPEYHSVGLGKHCVGLDAHSYKDFLNDENAVLIKPNAKIASADGKFFHPGFPYNQGSFFDFSEDDMISACYKAIERVKTNRLNTAGLKLQALTYKETVDNLLSVL
jgi:hypothetical protein